MNVLKSKKDWRLKSNLISREKNPEQGESGGFYLGLIFLFNFAEKSILDP